jgi:hypothetical protein
VTGSGACGCIERGHRFRAPVLLIERDVVARQADPVEGDEEAERGSGGAEDEARLGELLARSDSCGVRAARFHVPSRT